MPIYEYQAKDETVSCPHCIKPFECMRRVSDPALEKCPECGSPVLKVFSIPSVGSSRTGFDRRAKESGFTKLQRLGKGEYEKKY